MYMWFFIYLLVPIAVLDYIVEAYNRVRPPRDTSEHLFPLSEQVARAGGPPVHVRTSDTPAPCTREQHEREPEDMSGDAEGTMNWVVTEVGALRVNYETWQEYKPNKKNRNE